MVAVVKEQGKGSMLKRRFGPYGLEDLSIARSSIDLLLESCLNYHALKAGVSPQLETVIETAVLKHNSRYAIILGSHSMGDKRTCCLGAGRRMRKRVSISGMDSDYQSVCMIYCVFREELGDNIEIHASVSVPSAKD